MRHATRKRSNLGVLVIAGLAIVAAVVAIGALMFFQQPFEKPFEDESVDSATELTLTSEEFDGEEVLSIPTNYCNLYYPVDFEEVLRVEKSLSGDTETFAFYATPSEEEKVLLFEVCFGEAEGMKVGDFVTSEGVVPVYLSVEDVEPDGSDMLFGMQEGLNVVIDGLEANESFRLASEYR